MELKTIIKSLQTSVSCCICSESLKGPVSARCKHSFCDECITGAIKYLRPCPVCNKHSKLRSLKNSTRLRALVPLIQRLTSQLNNVNLYLTKEKTLEDSLQVDEPTTEIGERKKCEGDHALLQGSDAQNKSTPNKSSRLWGRLLSASASSSSNEDQNSSLRGGILQNEPCQQSVEAKVANWLESSIPVTMDEHLKDDPEPEEMTLLNDEFSPMPSAAHPVDGNKMDDDKLKEVQSSIRNNECNENNVSLQASIFPPATVLRTFSSTNKLNSIHRPKAAMQFSQDTTSCNSANETDAVAGLGDNFKESENENTIARESKTKESSLHESPDKGTSTAVVSEKTLPGEQRQSQIVPDEMAQEVSSSKSTSLLHCKRVEIYDAVQIKKYGYADIHAENSEENIVLRHLEEAIAKIPQCKPLPSWGSACDTKNEQRDIVKRANIVHKSQDLISALVENFKPEKVATKRHLQTAKSTKSSKLARRSDIANGASFVPKYSVSDDDQTVRRRSLRTPTQRSYSSETRRRSSRCDSFSCSQPGGVPKSMTNVFVKMIRLDSNSKALSTTSEKPPVIQVSPTPEKGKTGSDRVVGKGRSLNIDLSKPLQWQHLTAEEDDDIICCSWNEPEKVADEISHSRCDSPVRAICVDSIPVTNAMNAVNDDELLKACSLDFAGISKVIDSLSHVAELDTSQLLPHFAASLELVNGAIDMCKQAAHMLNVELNKKNLELQKSSTRAPAANSPQRSAVDSSPVPSAVDDCVADLVKSNSSWADELVSNSEKSHHVKTPTRRNQTFYRSHEAGTESNVSDIAAVDARSEDMLESLLPNEKRIQLVVDDGKSFVQNSHKACDDVVAAKVESWLNRLTDLDERQGKKHKKLIGTKWRSSPHGNGKETILKHGSQNIAEENSGFSNTEFKIASSFELPENDHSKIPSNVTKDSKGCPVSKKLGSLVDLTQKSPLQKNSVLLSTSASTSGQSKSDIEAGFSRNKNIAYHGDSSSHNMFEESMVIDSQLAGIICAGNPQSNNTEINTHKANKSTDVIYRDSPTRRTRKNSSKIYDENCSNAIASIQGSMNIERLESDMNGHDQQQVKAPSVNSPQADFSEQNITPKKRSIQNQHHSSTLINTLGFVTSGLQESEIKLVKLFAKRYEGKYHDVFRLESVTHVIMRTTKKRSCDRTLKYLMGIASKKWVVSIRWVIDSLHAGLMLQEDDYEVLGDNCMKEFGVDPCSNIPRGPTRSRTSGIHYKLLEYFLCICVPPFCLITIEQTSKLLELCGATVASSFDEFKVRVEKENRYCNRLVIVDAEVAADFPNYSSVEKEFNAAVINIEWVYESISRFEAQPLSNFTLSTFTQDSSVRA